MRTLLRSIRIPALQVVLLLTVAPFATAYIGPGSGISVIGSLLGLLATVLIAIGAIALFPFRKMMKKRAKAKDSESAVADLSQEAEEPALEPVRSENPGAK